ncbi:hypothetical protein DFQ28_005335 [Apophysomyces sp. BC1034]|nr:hypothetical protein DFQ30_005169 [Apophysomyces sp. BC1015]KAG0177876.1 hypothetical protein DFQ29_004244 [Apophysomyces sp. BC1021]KAG0188134.1 hypothetical protein DFQ28_005335 [Apophysomyces sp. BC1034]
MSNSMQTLYQSVTPKQDEKDGNPVLFFDNGQNPVTPPSIDQSIKDDSPFPSLDAITELQTLSESISKVFDFTQNESGPPVTPQPWLELKIDTDDSATEDEEPSLSPLTMAGLSRALSLPPSLLDEIAVGKPRTEVISISTANPSHLFWVPASQHPEIAPAEFEKYVRTHGSAHRRKSRVRRRKSILSVSFTPDDQDQEEDNTGLGKDTLSDRQTALETLENQTFRRNSVGRSASTDDDEVSERKARLRRSVSLQLPSIRGFDSTTPRGRRQSYRQTTSAYPLVSVNRSEKVPAGGVTLMDRPVLLEEPETMSAVEIPESYESCESRESHESRESCEDVVDEESTPPEPATAEVQALSVARDVEGKEEHRRLSRSNTTSAVPGRSERKSTWSWAFWSDEKTKKTKAESKNELRGSSEELDKVPPTEKAEPPLTESAGNNPTTTPNNNKRFVLSSLFSRKSSSSSKSSSTEHLSSGPTPPKDFQLNKINQNRLPIHVERAIYRMSHIKLANPRRPLQEQVLISNLMFWYLSIISSQQQQQSNATGDAAHDMMHQKNARMVVAASKKKKRLVRKDRPPQGRSTPANAQQQKGQGQGQGRSKDSGALLQYMGGGSRESTGFVIPENYLRPQSRSHSKNKLPNGADARRSSLDDDESDEDEEANDVDESDSSEDELFEKKSTPSPKPRPPHKKGSDPTNKPTHTHTVRQKDEDDLPLAMYRKEKR